MKLKTDKVLYPKISYRVIGIAFDVFNKLGPNQQEKIYQKAFVLYLEDDKIDFIEQLYCPIKIKNEIIGKYFLDFLIDKKIVVELKVGNTIYKKDYKQVKAYLSENNLELGIIILFSPRGVKYKRILNSNHNIRTATNNDSNISE